MTGTGHRRRWPARPPRNALRRFTFVRHHDASMASFRPALTEAPQRITKPHWGRPVNSGPRPCLFDVGFPLSGLQVRTHTSDLNVRAQHTRSIRRRGGRARRHAATLEALYASRRDLIVRGLRPRRARRDQHRRRGRCTGPRAQSTEGREGREPDLPAKLEQWPTNAIVSSSKATVNTTGWRPRRRHGSSRQQVLLKRRGARPDRVAPQHDRVVGQRQVISLTGRPTSAALRARGPSRVHTAVSSCCAR